MKIPSQDNTAAEIKVIEVIFTFNDEFILTPYLTVKISTKIMSDEENLLTCSLSISITLQLFPFV